jgi:hypothetical protein
LNNKLKDKNEVTTNGILAQTNGGIENKSDNKKGLGKKKQIWFHHLSMFYLQFH